ncbi:MAG: glyoxalase [Chlorobi bacterium]|nr:glyoxalase [Chlorobiota bacterium]
MNKTYFIIYVDDIEKTKMFYELLFDVKPTIDEPGMCELELPNGAVLGIMPNTSLEKLFGAEYRVNEKKKASPKFEFYFQVDNAEALYQKALQLGALSLRKFTKMDWGDRVAYCVNHDGHILAFAERME